MDAVAKDKNIETAEIPSCATRIGENGFNECTQLKFVIIPDNITEIGAGAFSSCSSLTEITLPSSVTIIKERTFSNCSNLEKVTLSEGLLTISGNTTYNGAFYDCPKLAEITIPDSVTSIDSLAFYRSPTRKYANLNSEGAYALNRAGYALDYPDYPNIALWYRFDGDTVIALDAVAKNNDIETAEIPSCATRIGENGFMDCTKLKSVTIPENITEISSGAFSGCSSLTEVTISSGVTVIKEKAFAKCSNLTKVTLSEGLLTIGGTNSGTEGAFFDCPKLTEITIPDSVTSINKYAFSGSPTKFYCSPKSSGAKAISAAGYNFFTKDDPDFGMRYISSGSSQKLALYTYTGNDAVVEIPEYVEHVTEYAFNKKEIEELILPDSLVSISNTALNNMKNTLRRIVFSDGLAEIPSGMFSGFNQLEEIVFLEGVTGIAANAIINCPKLSSVTAPVTMTAIDASNFRNCPVLLLSVYPGSFAEGWAEENAIPFAYVSQNALIVRVDEEQAEQYNGLYLVLSTDGNETVRVMDGSLKYIFYGVTEMNSHRLYIKNQYGHLVSKTLNIVAKPDKTECTIPPLLSLVDVHLTIRDEAMNNVSDSADIVWMDASGEQIASGQTLGSIPVGKKLTAQITLRGQVALDYKQPDPLTLTVNENSKAKSVYLQRAQGGSGASITLNGTYEAANKEIHSFSEWDKAAFDIENVTTGDSHLAYVVDNGKLFLGRQANDGDNLYITLSAKDGDFLPVSTNVQLGSEASADFCLVQKGVLSASFESETPVTMLVYNDQGKLAWSGDSDRGEITTIGLDEGAYTAVLMASAMCETIPEKLSALQRMGLSAGEDYAMETVHISEGNVAAAQFGQITTSNKTCSFVDGITFVTNSRMPSVGKYLTLKTSVAIKDAFKETIQNVYWEISFPNHCALSTDTLTISGGAADYYKNESGNIIVPVEDPAGILRACFIPLSSETLEINGTFHFTENGQSVSIQADPIRINAEGLKINVPEKSNSTRNYAGGTISGTAKVLLYDNGQFVGETETNSNGTWKMAFDLVKPYTYSSHYIKARFVTSYGELESDTALLQYQYVENPISVKSVEMRNNSFGVKVLSMINTHLGENAFSTDEQSIASYSYNPSSKTITFDVKFEGKDLQRIKTVNVQLSLSNGNSITLACAEKSEGVWSCGQDFYSTGLPSAIKVVFTADEEVTISSEQIDDINNQETVSSEEDGGIILLENIASEGLDEEDLEEINALIDQCNETAGLLITYENSLIRYLTPLFENYYDENGTFYCPSDTSSYIQISTCSMDAGYLADNGYEKIRSTNNSEVYVKEGTTNNQPTITAYMPNESKQISFNSSTNNSGSYTPWRDLSDFEKDMDDFADNISQQSNKYERELEALKDKCNATIAKDEKWVASHQKELNEIQDEISNLKRERSFLQSYDQLADTSSLDKKIAQYEKDVAQLEKEIASKQNSIADLRNQAEIAGKGAKAAKVLGIAADGVGVMIDGVELYQKYIPQGKNLATWQAMNGLDEDTRAELDRAIKFNKNYQNGKWWAIGLGAVGMITAGVGLCITAPVWLTATGVVAVIGGGILAVADLICQPEYDKMYGDLEGKFRNGGGGYNAQGSGRMSGIIDPSGFVYEAVLSNRLEGVEATVWQKETKYDMYDEPYEEITQWDAAPYDQVNPQITQEDGIYAWDVPDGLWQVRLWKNGYEEAQSDWLTVPPPHFNVNIGMVNREKPKIESVTVTENDITIEFDKYVDVNTVNGNVRLYCDHTNTSFALSFPDAEASANNPSQTLARTAVLTLDSPLAAGTSIELTVSGQVCSYAGTLMENDYSYQDSIKGIQSLKAEAVTLTKGQESYVSVIAEPAEVAQGMIVTVTGDLAALGMDERVSVQLNSFGRGSFAVRGITPGTYSLLLSLEDTEISAEVTVTVIVQQSIIDLAVTYDDNGATGGSAPMDGNTYVSGAVVTVLGNTGGLEKTGYIFTGWNTAADGNGTAYAADDTLTIDADVTLYAQWIAAAPRIAYCNLVLGGVPTMRYYVQLPEGFAGTDAAMTFSLPRRNDRTVALDDDRYVETVNGTEVNAYYFDCPVYVYQLADTIQAVFTWTEDGVENSVTDSGYSVQEYLNDIISDPAGTYSSQAVALAVAAKNFGHCVQPYLAGLNGWTVGVEYARIDGDSVDVDGAKAGLAANPNTAYTLDRSVPGLSKVNSAEYYVNLTDSVTLYFKIQMKSSPSGAVTAKVDGQPCSVSTLGNNTYRIGVSGVAANNMNKKWHVEFFAGEEEVFDITASVLSYLNAMLSNDGASGEEQQAMASLYYYYDAAEAYQNSLQQ